VAQKAVPIDFRDTARMLFDKMTTAAAELIGDVWPLMLRGTIPEIPQDHRAASYFGGRKPEDGRIDWAKPAVSIYNLVRAVTHPYPGAFTTAGGRTLFIWWAEPDEHASTAGARPGQVMPPPWGKGLPIATGQGVLLVKSAQWEGGAEASGDAVGTMIGIPEGAVLG
jgi:methionyl-tRNA formyltransferase